MEQQSRVSPTYRFKFPLLSSAERSTQLPAGGLQGQTDLRALRSNLPYLDVCKTEICRVVCPEYLLFLVDSFYRDNPDFRFTLMIPA